jgi:hypothetical protein
VVDEAAASVAAETSEPQQPMSTAGSQDGEQAADDAPHTDTVAAAEVAAKDEFSGISV